MFEDVQQHQAVQWYYCERADGSHRPIHGGVCDSAAHWGGSLCRNNEHENPGNFQAAGRLTPHPTPCREAGLRLLGGAFLLPVRQAIADARAFLSLRSKIFAAIREVLPLNRGFSRHPAKTAWMFFPCWSLLPYTIVSIRLLDDRRAISAYALIYILQNTKRPSSAEAVGMISGD